MPKKNSKTLNTTSHGLSEMNDLAQRIWDGQGSLPDKERISRIKSRLIAKGYSDKDIAQLDFKTQ